MGVSLPGPDRRNGRSLISLGIANKDSAIMTAPTTKIEEVEAEETEEEEDDDGDYRAISDGARTRAMAGTRASRGEIRVKYSEMAS